MGKSRLSVVHQPSFRSSYGISASMALYPSFRSSYGTSASQKPSFRLITNRSRIKCGKTTAVRETGGKKPSFRSSYGTSASMALYPSFRLITNRSRIKCGKTVAVREDGGGAGRRWEKAVFPFNNE